MRKKYTGGCHCGAVRYEVEADLSSAIECNCSYCSQKGLVLTFVPGDAFRLLAGEKDLTDYRFHTKKIAHLFCRHCGVQSFGRGARDDGTPTVAINVRCLDDVDLTALKPRPFNGKDM